MADIQKLDTNEGGLFDWVDGQTPINRERMKLLCDTINEIIDKVNGGVEEVEFIVTNESYPALEGYLGTIKEFYLTYPVGAEAFAPGCCIKFYSNRIFVRPVTDASSHYAWTAEFASAVVSAMEDNVVYEIKVTQASLDSSVSVGDVVGYVVFKDIAKFKLNAISSNINDLNVDYISNIRYSPQIKAYIESQ